MAARIEPSIISELAATDPTTLKTPPGDYETRNFSEKNFFNEHDSNSAHVDRNLSL